MRAFFTVSIVSAIALLAAMAGCEAAGGPNEFGGTESGQGAAGPAGAGGSSGVLSGGTAGSSAGTLSGTNSQGVGGGCAGINKTAEKAPLDMYIMLDQSGSMSDPPSQGGGTKWDLCESALDAFVAQPASAGIGVGIQYFPLSSGVQCNPIPFCTMDADCGAPACGPCMVIGGFGVCMGASSGDSCTPSDYATPDVEIGVLPGNAAAITASIASHGPTGGTPTSAALEGAVSHATAWAAANPGHVVVAVLATDGDPTSCNTDLGYINGVAAAGANAMPPIRTFVIGVGGSVGALNGIAAAGGTQQAFMIDQDPNVQQAFLDALNAIQGQALPCSYLLPDPGQGEMLNPDQVNVSYTPGGSDMAQTIPKVNSAADCPPNGLAWYYDNNQNPTQIILCPNACATLSADTQGKVEIVLGCATIVN